MRIIVTITDDNGKLIDTCDDVLTEEQELAIRADCAEVNQSLALWCMFGIFSQIETAIEITREE